MEGDIDGRVGAHRRDWIRTRLEFERRGHSIENLEVLAQGCLGVAMEIHEARGHHEAADINHLVPGEFVFGNRPNPPAVDGQIAHGIQTRFRIHDPTAEEHQARHLGNRRQRNPAARHESHKSHETEKKQKTGAVPSPDRTKAVSQGFGEDFE